MHISHNLMEITLPVHSLQESRKPSHHKCIVMKDLTLTCKSAKLCFSVTNNHHECTHLIQKINKQMVSTGRTHRYYAWTTWCHQQNVLLHFRDQQWKHPDWDSCLQLNLQQYHTERWRANSYREVDYRAVLAADEHSSAFAERSLSSWLVKWTSKLYRTYFLKMLAIVPVL